MVPSHEEIISNAWVGGEKDVETVQMGGRRGKRRDGRRGGGGEERNRKLTKNDDCRLKRLPFSRPLTKRNPSCRDDSLV